MNMLHSVDIGSRLNGWMQARKFKQVAHEADVLFCEACPDPDMVGYMADLPLADLPEVQAALLTPGQPDQQALEDAVRKAIAQDWKQLSPEQVERAVDVYLCCLGRAMLPGVQVRSSVDLSVYSRAKARAYVAS